ncbi:MAG: hypothetical protein R3D62_15250 [Xanthobacteraceae bacterium]
MQIRSALKTVAVNTALVTGSILLTYLVFGHLVLRYYLPYVPPTTLWSLPDLPAIVGQTSKKSELPHDYIVLLGDSYAQGVGDWQINAAIKGSRRYHSAHVMQDLTGHDVISLGRWGYNSAQAMVLKPAWVYDGHCLAYPTPESPRQIVVYFFEGNDFIDNYRWLEIRLPSALSGNSASKIDNYLTKDYGAPAWWRCYGNFGLVVRQMAKIAAQRLRSLATAAPSAPPPPAHHSPERPSPERRHGVRDEVLANVHLGPSTTLTDQELDLATTVFSRSLAWLRRRFPNVPILVVYLPSPAIVYRLPPGKVQMREKSSLVPYQSSELYARSQRMCTMIRLPSIELGARFLDTRPTLRAAAATQLLHGPLDWDHFNEAGYHTLGKAVAQAIASPGDQGCMDWASEQSMK